MITKKGLQRITILLLAVIAAMLVGSLLIIASGANPIDAYYYMLIRPMSSISALGEVSMHFTPLLLIGIGVSFTFHAVNAASVISVSPSIAVSRIPCIHAPITLNVR